MAVFVLKRVTVRVQLLLNRREQEKRRKRKEFAANTSASSFAAVKEKLYP